LGAARKPRAFVKAAGYKPLRDEDSIHYWHAMRQVWT
jgi:hypothetical protein